MWVSQRVNDFVCKISNEMTVVRTVGYTVHIPVTTLLSSHYIDMIKSLLLSIVKKSFLRFCSLWDELVLYIMTQCGP